MIGMVNFPLLNRFSTTCTFCLMQENSSKICTFPTLISSRLFDATRHVGMFSWGSEWRCATQLGSDETCKKSRQNCKIDVPVEKNLTTTYGHYLEPLAPKEGGPCMSGEPLAEEIAPPATTAASDRYRTRFSQAVAPAIENRFFENRTEYCPDLVPGNIVPYVIGV